LAGVAAIAGLPPFGVFMSEFLIVSSTFHAQPVLAVALVLGLLLAFGALLMRATDMAFGEPRGPAHPVHASHLPAMSHFALVLMAGIWLPPPLVAWFTHVAALLG
jgi:hydrogenase-4 component F